MKVRLEADIPRELVTQWLQYVRDFDVKHAPNVHFVMGIDEAGLTEEEVVGYYAGIKPALKHLMRFSTKV